VRQLRRNVDAPVEERWNRSLLVQRLRSILQDERAKSTPHQAQAQTGKCKSRPLLILFLFSIISSITRVLCLCFLLLVSFS
jgi:hypothetical protein